MYASCKCVTASVHADLLCCLNAKESQSVQCVATNKPDETEHIAKSQITCVLHVSNRPVMILDSVLIGLLYKAQPRVASIDHKAC